MRRCAPAKSYAPGRTWCYRTGLGGLPRRVLLGFSVNKGTARTPSTLSLAHVPCQRKKSVLLLHAYHGCWHDSPVGSGKKSVKVAGVPCEEGSFIGWAGSFGLPSAPIIHLFASHSRLRRTGGESGPGRGRADNYSPGRDHPAGND